MAYQPLPAIPTGRPLIRRFWASASGFWFGDNRRTAWLLTFGLIALIFIQIGFQYRMNIWSRDIFNALEEEGAGFGLDASPDLRPACGDHGGVGRRRRVRTHDRA